MVYDDYFVGDKNKILKTVQHEQFYGLLPSLFEHARVNYLKAVRFIGIRTELTEKITEFTSFEHRALINAYNIIAAYYRYQYPDKDGQLILPITQPQKLSPEETLNEHYKQEWCDFWHREIRELTKNGQIATAILITVVYQNAEKGYEAEDLLQKLLKNRYHWDDLL